MTQVTQPQTGNSTPMGCFSPSPAFPACTEAKMEKQETDCITEKSYEVSLSHVSVMLL